MASPLDIFKVEPTGDVRWLEPAKDLETANARLKVLGAVMPGKYVVFSQRTGNRTFFQVDEDGRLSEVADAA